MSTWRRLDIPAYTTDRITFIRRSIKVPVNWSAISSAGHSICKDSKLGARRDKATVSNSCPRTENCPPPNKPNSESDQPSVKSKGHAIHKNVVVIGTGGPFKSTKTVPRNIVTRTSSSHSSGSSFDNGDHKSVSNVSTSPRSRRRDSGHNMSTRSAVSRTPRITFAIIPRNAYMKNDDSDWYFNFCNKCSTHADSNFQRWRQKYGMRLMPKTCTNFNWTCSSCGERGSCTDTSIIGQLITRLSDQWVIVDSSFCTSSFFFVDRESE